jgi:HPr kinase/phosphorylase
MIRVHGTSVALGGGGILLRGPSGCGKSDLALRLIDRGAHLVADDQTELYIDGDDIRMTAPAAIAGQIEIRGLGIRHLPYVTAVPLRAVVDLVAPAQIERMPEPSTCVLLNRTIPLITLAPFEASAVAKLRLVLNGAAPVVP